MERYVAFDIGDKRIGVAISDPFNTYALLTENFPWTNIEILPRINTRQYRELGLWLSAFHLFELTVDILFGFLH